MPYYKDSLEWKLQKTQPKLAHETKSHNDLDSVGSSSSGPILYL